MSRTHKHRRSRIRTPFGYPSRQEWKKELRELSYPIPQTVRERRWFIDLSKNTPSPPTVIRSKSTWGILRVLLKWVIHH